MTNPFFSQQISPKVDPEHPILLKCRHCPYSVQRSEVDGVWCHSDDEIIIYSGQRVVHTGNYDHVAIPDVIDIEEVKDQD